MLAKDLLYVVTSQTISYFRLYAEHMEWLGENKKLMKESMQSMKDSLKVAEEKATKEAKLSEWLKKQLQEKLNGIAKKNKALLDYHRKANEGEEKLLDLRWEVTKISSLEARIKKLEGTVSSQDETLVAREKTHQKDLEYWKAAITWVVEDYKSSDGFANEVIEATRKAFDNGFNSCRNLVGKLFSNLDLSGITCEAGLALASEGSPLVESPVDSLREAPQASPIVPAVLLHPKVEASSTADLLAPASAEPLILAPMSTEVPTFVEVISLEDDPTAISTKASKANA
ncbi:hypothetical protein COCNU_scaffold012904G000040 [Cocos nucifera]|nr:hypothetical protein [Cocos nucifera]